MRLTAQQKIRVGFGLLLILPTVLCVLAVHQIDRLIESAESVAATEKVLSQLHETSSLLKDVEVDQREFMLTGDITFLNSFNVSEKRVFDQLEAIEKDSSYNRRLQYNIDTLKNLVLERFNDVHKTNELRRSGGLEAAAGVIKNNLGKQPIEDTRKLLAQMISTERGVLNQGRAEQKRSFQLTLVVFGIVLLLNFFFVYFLRFFMKREAAEHEREELRIRELNQKLEERVRQRTVELQRSNEDLQQFAYMVSHDLKEPLRMVASYTELLQRRYAGKLDEQADEFIGFAVQGVRRMSALIEDMLTYSRATETRAVELTPISAAEPLRAALENLRMRIDETGAEITQDAMPEVLFDPVSLTQLFQNLVANALKYRSEQTPRVHVGAALKNSETIFSVRDNGIGIDAADRDKVFGVFQRLHGREYEGSGIGLATCKKIVERRGGRIWFESEPGKGSTFYFTVPAVTEESEPATPKTLTAGK